MSHNFLIHKASKSILFSTSENRYGIKSLTIKGLMRRFDLKFNNGD